MIQSLERYHRLANHISSVVGCFSGAAGLFGANIVCSTAHGLLQTQLCFMSQYPLV